MSFAKLFEFEEKLAEYTGAPYVVLTDGCTHALELCMRVKRVKSTSFPAYTYVSVVNTIQALGIKYTLEDKHWVGEYQFAETNIWDSARKFMPNMFVAGQMQCLSFGHGKPLQIGKVGAILLDNKEEYNLLSLLRSDGRDLKKLPWHNYPVTHGYHYCPTIEDCESGLNKLAYHEPKEPFLVRYPDCRKLVWL